MTANRNQAQIAPLGRRFAAALLDRLVPGVLVGLWYWLVHGAAASASVILDVLFAAVLLGWIVVQWWFYAMHKAGLGYRLCGLQLVGFKDGRPVGWWRMFVRTIVLWACWALVLPGIALCVFLVIQQRRQGWHDMAAGSLSVRLASVNLAAGVAGPVNADAGRRSSSSMVALPPHLLHNSFESPTQAAAPGGLPPAGNPTPPPAQPITHVPSWGAGQSSDRQVPNRLDQDSPAAAQPMGQPVLNQMGQPIGQPVLNQMGQPIGQPVLNQMAQPTGQQPVAGSQPGDQSATRPPQAGLLQSGQPQTDQPTARPPQAEQQAPWQPPAKQPVQWPPQTTPVPQPHQPMRVKPRTTDVLDADDYGGTRLVNAAGASRPGNEGWHVRLDNGQDVPVRKALLIGRHPAPNPDESDTAVLAAGQPDGTVSKTHLLIGVDAKGVFVTDRASTNGTALLSADGELTPCQPNVPMRVSQGQVVSFGERTLQILRYPSGN